MTVDLSNLNAGQGFIIQGDSAGGEAGFSVSNAGDVNGDGFDDLIIGAPRGDDGGIRAGEAYVIYGGAGLSNIDLSALAGSQGFIIQGDTAFDEAGISVSNAGDVNGDGLDDLIIGAPEGDDGGDRAGEAYVIYGNTNNFTLTSNDDRYTGTSASETVSGLDGNDTILTLAGDDIIDGGAGNDTIFGGADNDMINGGLGFDTISSGIGNDNVHGGGHNDTILGQGGDDILYGDGGADTLRGGSGNDTLHGGDARDLLFGQGNNDILFGEGGNDTLSGAAGLDELFGGDGDDNLNGGIGGDRLDGGTGNDILNGGGVIGVDGARDSFVFAVGYEQDRINSFDQAGNDRIELDDALWAAAGTLTSQEVVDMFGSLNASGSILTLDFGNGDILVQNAAGIDMDNFGADILVI